MKNCLVNLVATIVALANIARGLKPGDVLEDGVLLGRSTAQVRGLRANLG